MPRDTYLRKVLGDEQLSQLRQSTVLMVGAGGIGCELLKNLMLSGFGTVHIVDLDTITLSNLNRQFLFRQTDIDKSKSVTIKRAVEQFNFHGCHTVSHHGNIMDTDMFPVEWWLQFNYIFNALDNLEARRYVNRMALLLDKPVMESGTTGFDGYVQPIFPHKTECFDCQPKVTPKTFPVCTIRSTPSRPIHCITWAKEFLFQQLFDVEEGSLAADLANATSDAAELANLMRELNELAELKSKIGTGGGVFKEMVKKIFQVDIERLSAIDSLWKHRQRPEPLAQAVVDQLEATVVIVPLDTQVWTVLQNLAVLKRATTKLEGRLQGETKFITFDKDDEDTLEFVAAAANLRSLIFHIEMLSQFDIKQIAGNIIPAIATTNAIILGFLNIEALNYLRRANRDDAAMVFISIRPNKYVTSAALEPPKPTCASCSVARSTCRIDLGATLEQFVASIKTQYGYPGDISIILGKSRLVYDFDFEDNLDKTLGKIGFGHGESVLIQDEEDALENLELQIIATGESQLPEIKLRQKVVADTGEPTAEEAATDIVASTSTGDLIESDKAFETILVDEEVEEPASKKRKRDDDE